MKIHEFYYNEDSRTLYTEFSTKGDGLDYYRVLELGYDDILFYSPEIIDEFILREIDLGLVKDIITQYLFENELPEQLTL